MPRLSLGLAAAFACLALVTPTIAAAQQPLPPPAPGPPPGQYQPPPGQYQPPPPGYAPYPQQGQYQPPPPGYGGYGQPPPPGYGQPPPGYGQPQYNYPPPQQPQYYPQQPPRPAPQDYPKAPEPPEPPTHAPKFSLWTGMRLGYQGFGFSWYDNPGGDGETTGNLIGNGVPLQLDLGARISHRYILYLFWDHGFMSTGHRFNGEQNASASTDYYGLAFRHLGGDVDTVSFLTEIAIGLRSVNLYNTVGGVDEKYKMSGIEFFKLGLGAEIRCMTLFTIEPVLSISTGRLTDYSGTVSFAPNQGDGVQRPPSSAGEPGFGENGTIRNALPYVMLSLTLGVHFDVFGK